MGKIRGESQIETEPKSVLSKKSYLAILLAFNYRQNPSVYNLPENGIVDLQSFVNFYYQKVAAGDTDGLDFLPEDCRTPEACARELSDEEIVRLVEDWKQGDPKNSTSFDEYLRYLLDKPAAAAKEKPESRFDINQVKINVSHWPEAVIVDIPGEGEDKIKRYVINPPVAARAASEGEKENFLEVLKNLIIFTRGNFYPRFRAGQNETLQACFGSGGKRSDWKVLEEFSVPQLAELSGTDENKIKTYLALRRQKWEELSEADQKAHDEFENWLKQRPVRSESTGRSVSFRQNLRDLAVAREWVELIGTSRYEELKQQISAKSGKRHPETKPGGYNASAQPDVFGAQALTEQDLDAIFNKGN